MKMFLIDNKSNLRSVLLWLNVLIFSYAISLYSMPGSSDLPSSFPTEPVSSEINVESGSGQAGGPETVAIADEKAGEQGNWVKKKQWLLKSFEINNNIYNLALQIADTRNIYSTKNDAISDELQTFYKNLGVEQGKLQELFDSVERYLEKKKKKDLAAVTVGEKQTDADRDYQIKVELLDNQVKQLKDELDQLKLDMKSVEDIGKSLNQRLEKADEQIVSAMNLAESAKSKVEDLWGIIDDKKARLIYYDLSNIEENLKVILTYLKDTLAADFDAVIQNAKKQMEVASDGIKKLEQKGLIIKDRSSRVEKLKLQELQKIEHDKYTAETVDLAAKTPARVDDKNKNIGLWQTVYNYCIDIYIKIYKYVSGFWKTSSPDKKVVAPSAWAGQALSQQAMTSQLTASDKGLTTSQTQAAPAETPQGPEALSQSVAAQPQAIPSMQLIQ